MEDFYKVLDKKIEKNNEINRLIYMELHKMTKIMALFVEFLVRKE